MKLKDTLVLINEGLTLVGPLLIRLTGGTNDAGESNAAKVVIEAGKELLDLAAAVIGGGEDFSKEVSNLVQGFRELSAAGGVGSEHLLAMAAQIEQHTADLRATVEANRNK